MRDDQISDEEGSPGPVRVGRVEPDTAPPSGTITFLFTDIEGSTRFWEYYPEAMQRTLVRHDLMLRQVMAEHDGYIFATAGDAFSVAFHSPRAAIEAALEGQRLLALDAPDEMGRFRVRMVIHTGTADERDGDYFGPTLNRCGGRGGRAEVGGSMTPKQSRSLPPQSSLRSDSSPVSGRESTFEERGRHVAPAVHCNTEWGSTSSRSVPERYLRRKTTTKPTAISTAGRA